MNRHSFKIKKQDLTEGPVLKGLLSFCLPILLGQILQQMYNLADAWVIGNFADNNAFAAVSSAGNVIWLITGFSSGFATGGGVIISLYFGARDRENVSKSIHNNLLVGLILSGVSTLAGVLLVPWLMTAMQVPEEVVGYSLLYFRIYFWGVSTVILYNILMSILRALGDSLRPLFYLAVSSVLNVILDLLFVAAFRWGVAGAAVATVFSQGVSVVLCLVRMMKNGDESRVELRKLRMTPGILREVLVQSIPTGLQGSIISIGNIVIQTNINTFGAYAMSGFGAYSKIESLGFLPITCIAMALPTFVSQNLGAGKDDRARRGAVIGIALGVGFAQCLGFLAYLFPEPFLRIFISEPEAIAYGLRHAAIHTLFYFALAFSHTSAGALRGAGRAVIPMAAMILSWCAIRICYVTVTLRLIPVYDVICWAYPITWSITTVIFFAAMVKVFAKKKA